MNPIERAIELSELALATFADPAAVTFEVALSHEQAGHLPGQPPVSNSPTAQVAVG